MSTTPFTLTTRDNLTLRGSKYTVDHAGAVVCLIHGLGEHYQRYAHVIEAFNRHGLSFYAMDLRGHGQSDGPRGHTPSYHHLLDDIDLLVELAEKENPALPLVLYGHSMGGNLALNYLLLRDSADFAGGLITSPWLRLTHPPKGPLLWLAHIGNKLLPTLAQGNGLKVEDISSVPAVQQDYANDPLNHDRITPRLFMEVNKMGRAALENAPYLHTPVLLAHGSADNITSPAASQEFAGRAPKGLVELKIWDGLRHETHNEHNKEEVIAFYADWIANKLP